MKSNNLEVLPPQLYHAAMTLLDTKASRQHKDNAYHTLIRVSDSLDSVIKNYEKQR